MYVYYTATLLYWLTIVNPRCACAGEGYGTCLVAIVSGVAGSLSNTIEGCILYDSCSGLTQ